MSLIEELQRYDEYDKVVSRVTDWVRNNGSKIVEKDIEVDIRTAPAEVNSIIAEYIANNKATIATYINSQISIRSELVKTNIVAALQEKIDEISK